MNYVFSGYVTGPSLNTVTPAQAKKLTHMNVAFGVVKDDKINTDALKPYLDGLARIRKWNPQLNILLSTGGGNQHGHGPATADEAHLEAFVKSTMDAVREYGFDGIDCDWEFPCDDGNVAEKQQHTRLLAAYRQELDAYAEERGRKCWLTTAAACGQWYIDCTEIAKSHAYLDYLNLMSYDLRGWNQPSGHHTCLYEPEGAPVKFSADASVRLLTALGIPAEKLVLGAAFYSRMWKNVKDVNHGMHELSPTGGGFGPTYTEIKLVHERAGRFTKYWDDTAKACWLFDGTDFISYDDPRSIREKCAYVRKNGLGGMMYWEHGCDLTSELFDTIYDSLFLG